MINGLEGIPGSGKSYEACVYHVLVALQAGRMVITNLPLNLESFAAIDGQFIPLLEVRRIASPIRGTWNVKREGNAFQITGEPVDPADSVPVFGHVWDYYSEWKHPVTGQGPLFVVDECHVAMPKGGTDREVVQFYKLHRHFNVDVLLMTQMFRDMDLSIAGLLHMMVRVRKADIIGKPKSYIRKVHGGFRGALISKEIRDYKPQYFPLYKSHTQGNSVSEGLASDVVPLSVRFKRVQWIFFALAIPLVAWMWWPKSKPEKPPVSLVSVAPLSPPVRSASAPAAPNRPLVPSGPVGGIGPGSSVTGGDPEPLEARGLHLTGRMSMAGKTVYTFAISNNATYVNSVTSRELESMGYQIEPHGDCMAFIRWKDRSRSTICDAPRPLTVMAVEPPPA